MTPNTYPIAVIGDGMITSATGSRPYPTGDIINVTGLATIALAKADGQRAMWIAPGSDLARKATQAKFWKEFQLGPEPNWNVFAVGPQDSTPNAASVRRTGKGAHKEDRREVMIYADLDTRWMLDIQGEDYGASPWPSQHEALLQCLETYERHMGVQARFTPASTALALLQQVNQGCSSVAYLDPLSRDVIDQVPWPIARAPGHANQRPRDGKYVHVFDKRSAYMASAMGEVGRGDPIHVADVGVHDDPNPEWQEMIDKEVPGLWCITADKGPRVPDALPSPFNTHGDMPDHEWYYGPQIKLARQMGYLITIHEGYIWPKHHRTLRTWVAALWTARQAVKDTPTEAMIKASFTQSLGVMSRRPGPTEKLQWYHRPDWNGLITAQHYLRHTRKIIEIEATHPGYLAESTDSVAWISDDPNWTTALPDGWRGKDGQIGQYRHVFTYAGDNAQTLITMAREGQSGARLYKQMNAWDAEDMAGWDKVDLDG